MVFDKDSRVNAAFEAAHRAAFGIKEIIPPSQWAEEHLSLARGLHARPGPWRNFPFQTEVLDSIADPDCGGVVLMWPSQLLGKSSILLCWIGWKIEQGAGGGIIMVLPTLFDAQSWSKTKLSSMIRESSVLKELLRPTSKRSGNGVQGDGQNTVALKVYSGGFLILVGANSPSGLASHSCNTVLCDEVDRYPLEVGAEGDAVSIVSRRASTFSDAFVAVVSSPTVKDFSRIEAEYSTTDQRKPFVPCPKCDHEFVMLWKDVVWDKDPETGEHLPETAHLVCPGCGAKLSDTDRVAMVNGMRWIATNPKVKNKRGYWANGLLCLLPPGRGYRNRLHQAVVEWLDAKHGGLEKLQTFKNTFLCEVWESPAEKMSEPEFLMMRREPYATGPLEADSFVLPQGVWAISCGCDAQVNRLELVLVGWGVGEEMWVLESRSIPGNLGQSAFWQELENYILTRWKHPSGEEVPVMAVGIDYGYQSAAVYRYVNTSAAMNVRAIKGTNAVMTPWVQRSKDEKKPRLVIAHVDAGKMILFQRLSLVEPGPGYVHFGQNLDREFFDQLTAERLVTHRSYGQPVRRFECPAGRANHAFDALNYALAARELVRINWKAMAKRYGGGELPEPAATASEENVSEGLASQAPNVARNAATRRRRQRVRGVWGNFKWNQW